MMNEDEFASKLNNLVKLITPENLASLSEEDLDKLEKLLDKVDEIVEK